MTTDTFAGEHLRPEMRPFLNLEGRARLYDCWERIWVPTPWTKTVFTALHDCVNAGDSTKPRGLTIIGDADTGKSRTMTAFTAKHPPKPDLQSEYAHHPVIYLRAPNTPSPPAILKAILHELGFPLLYNADPGDLRQHTVNMLRSCRVGTIIIDEIHDISKEYLSNKTVEFLRFIKSLINETGRPFTVGGVPAILDLIGSEDQVAGRLDTVIEMLPFKLNEDFVRIVMMFGKLMPLRNPSNLRDEAIIQHLYTHSQGFIGRLSRRLHDACQIAIESGEERITIDVLNKVPDHSIRTVRRRGK